MSRFPAVSLKRHHRYRVRRLEGSMLTSPARGERPSTDCFWFSLSNHFPTSTCHFPTPSRSWRRLPRKKQPFSGPWATRESSRLILVRGKWMMILASSGKLQGAYTCDYVFGNNSKNAPLQCRRLPMPVAKPNRKARTAVQPKHDIDRRTPTTLY